MHARYYSFHTARFLSVDPVKGEVGSSQSWNRYGYVRNNPVNALDSDGQVLNWVAGGIGAVAGAAIGGGIEYVKQVRSGGDVDWQKVRASAIGGAVTGGVAGVTMGGSMVATVVGAGSGAALGGVVERGTDGDASTVALDGDRMLVDGVGGAAGAGGAHIIAPVARAAGAEVARQGVKMLGPVAEKGVVQGTKAGVRAAARAITETSIDAADTAVSPENAGAVSAGAVVNCHSPNQGRSDFEMVPAH